MNNSDMKHLTYEDAIMLRYFHEAKGDMTRYVDWDKLQPALKNEWPELLDAKAKLDHAISWLEVVLDKPPKHLEEFL